MRCKLFIVVIGLLIMFGTAVSLGMENDPDSEFDESIDSTELFDNGEKELKNKTFYMYHVEDAVEVGGRTTKEIYNTTHPEERGNKTDPGDFTVLADWYLYPELVGDLQLDGTSTLSIWARMENNVPPSADLRYYLWEIGEDGEEIEIANNEERFDMSTEWDSYDIPLEIDNHTVSEGSTLRVTFHLWGDSEQAYEIAYGGYIEDDGEDFMADTNITLPCLDYMRVEDVHTRDHEGEPTDLFDPEAVNKNITMHASVTNPFGGYDIRWVNITLEGPEETIFENHSMEKTYGYFDSYLSTYEKAWNYTDRPEGTYNVTVRAVDNNGMIAYEETSEFDGHDEYGEHSFIIGGLDHHVNIRLEDDHGILLRNTTVNLKISEDVVFSSDETDEAGIVNFTVAEATYMVTVIWQDTEVSTNRTLDVGELGDGDRDEPVDVTAAVYYPTLEVLDREGKPVDESNVYMSHPNGTTMIEPIVTDDNGRIYLERYAEGNYTFQVDWKGRDVGEIELGVYSSEVISFNVDVYHLEVIIHDRDGDPVNNALLISSYEDTRVVADSTLSDQHGSVDLRLPATDYYFEVLWNDADVYEDTYELDESGTTIITADIFAVEVHVQDYIDEDLSESSVTAIYERTDKEIDTQKTDENGEAVFQLAAGEHRFEVEWLRVDVAEETRTIDEDNTAFHISASVYQVEIQARDSTEDKGYLSDADVSIYIEGRHVDTGRTDDQGVYVSQLPSTDINLRIEWRGIEVYRENHDIGDHEEDNGFVYLDDINCDVYYIHSEIKDSEGEPLKNTELKIEHQDRLIVTGETDEEGMITYRLPEAEYQAEMVWRDSHVGEETIEVYEEDRTVVLEADVHYIRIKVEGGDEPIEGVRLTLLKDGEPVMTERTDENGEVTFSQAVGGEYEVNARFRTTQYWTSIDIEETEEISLEESEDLLISFEEFPRPIYRTNLFYLILVLVAVGIGGSIAIAKKKEVI